MAINHERNYRMTLPLGIIITMASLAAIVTFIVYSIEWGSNSSNNAANTPAQLERESKATYAYQAAVMSLLVTIVFFNGYHLTKFR